MWNDFMAVFANPFILAVGIQQVIGGAYSWYMGDWRLAIINATVGVANTVLSTMRG